jgi:tetratricopeptide (TPR) repeat protein
MGDLMKVSALLLAVLLATASTGSAGPRHEVCDVAADYMLGLEKYPEAIRLHQQVLASQPDNALAHYHLGFAFGMIGHNQEEIREYVAAVHLGLNDWDLFLNLGLAYLGHDDIEASIQTLKKRCCTAGTITKRISISALRSSALAD